MALKLYNSPLTPISLVLVEDKSGSILNGDFKYTSTKLSPEEARTMKIEVSPPKSLKVLKSYVIDNSFYKLKIEKKDLDLSLVGKHVILIRYILKANRRSVIKELELEITSIVIA